MQHSILVLIIAIIALSDDTAYSFRLYGSNYVGNKRFLNRHPSIILAAANDRDQKFVGIDNAKRTLCRVTLPAIASFLSAIFLQFNCVTMAGASVPSTSAVPVYFGVGCFWHVQHEFVTAEQKILSRSNNQLTSAAGYAGGSKVFQSGGKVNDIVCYHNLQGQGDYGHFSC